MNQVAKAKDYPVDLYFLMDLSWWNISKFICECVRSIINFHPRNQDVDFNMLEIFFSFQCTSYDENRWLNTKLKKKDRHYSPKKTIRLFCTIVRWVTSVRWDPKWPWVPWQWVGMTFQAFRGPSGAQIAFTILLAKSIGDKMLYSDTVYCSVRRCADKMPTERLIDVMQCKHHGDKLG